MPIDLLGGSESDADEVPAANDALALVPAANDALARAVALQPRPKLKGANPKSQNVFERKLALSLVREAKARHKYTKVEKAQAAEIATLYGARVLETSGARFFISS